MSMPALGAMHSCVETTDVFKMECPPTFSAVLDILDNISDQYMGMLVHQMEQQRFISRFLAQCGL